MTSMETDNPKAANTALEKGSEVSGEASRAESNGLNELRRNLYFLEKTVLNNNKEKLPRVLRNNSRIRKLLSIQQLQQAIEDHLPVENPSREKMLQLLAPLKEDEQMADIDATTSANAAGLSGESTPRTLDVPEVEIYLFLLCGSSILQKKAIQPFQECMEAIIERLKAFNRRTMDPLSAKSYYYYSLSYEMQNKLPSLRNELLAAHRTACLRHDEFGQATLINLLLRSYLQESLYDQAFKLISKTTFPEAVSNNQFVRYLYYVGKIQAVQLDYTESYTKLMQAIRKAPQNTAIGFRRTVQKLAIIVQLLTGEIPERNVFNQPDLADSLQPYLELTNAVRIGNLKEFNRVLTVYSKVFEHCKTLTLIQRLRHNVIKTGLRKINVSYSRISFNDISQKLALGSPQDAEYVCAKAIRDGVIEATIDHENGWMQSKDTVDVYGTNDPQQAFQKRITFCLDVHNEAVKAMRYPPDAYRKELESAEERQEREKQEEELAKEIEDEMDEEGL